MAQGIIPLTGEISTYTDTSVTIGGDNQSITLQPGRYLIGYSGNVTDATGTAELAYYLNGIQLTETLSIQTVNNTTDVVNLSNLHVLSIDEESTLTLRNPGTNSQTVSGLITNITALD